MATVDSLTYGPCSWSNVEPLCTAEEWDTYSEDLQTQALDFATYIAWAATGRQYGLCTLTVRPCGRFCSGNNVGGWAYDGEGGWLPYPIAGGWKNCWCGNGPGCNTCEPDCMVYLPGPVHDVTYVQVDGASLPVTGGHFFVMDQQWLVRARTTAEEDEDHCWPYQPNLNLPAGSADAFEVTYRRGRPVPSALASAAANYAVEYAKACIGQPCRLPGRVASISRQGVSVNMVDIQQVLDNGLTGLLELDQLIMAINPHGMKGRTRFYSPDLLEPRQITWAG